MFSKINSQLAEWIPYVLVEEKKKMWSKMKDQDVFLIFDGTTREGEAFVIIARYVDEHFAVHQCLLRFLTVKQSLEGSQITMVVIQTLIEASIPIPKVLGSNRDGASVNVKAMKDFRGMRLEPAGPFWDMSCLAHFLNLVGGHIYEGLAHDFLLQWKQMLRSNKAKALWKQIAGCSVVTSSDTRWWSEWEQVNQISTLFPRVLQLLAHPSLAQCGSRKNLVNSIHFFLCGSTLLTLSLSRPNCAITRGSKWNLLPTATLERSLRMLPGFSKEMVCSSSGPSRSWRV